MKEGWGVGATNALPSSETTRGCVHRVDGYIMVQLDTSGLIVAATWVPAHHSSKGHMAKNPSLDRIFTYHAPFGTQAARYVALREAAKAFATAVRDLTPPSREQSLALTDIQRACQMANAAIAINEVEPVTPVDVTESVQSTDAAASTNQESV